MPGIRSPGSCLETSSANSEQRQSPQRATTSTTSSRRGAYWSDSEVNKLVQLVQLHKTEKGRVRWDDLSSAWESSRSTNDPPRSKEALRGTYARLVKRRGRATPIELGDAAELLTSSHSGSLFSNRTEVTFETQPNGGPENMVPSEASPEASIDLSTRFAVDAVDQVTSSLGNYSVLSSIVEAPDTPPDESSLKTDLANQDSQQGGVEPVEHIDERSTSPNGDSETSQPDRTLGDKLRERFDAYYKAAKESHDRQPIRRPKGEIPEGMLQLANEILSEKLGHTNSTNKRTLTALNAAVYAIAKAITTILLDGEAEKAGKTHQKLREAKALRDTLVSVVSTLSHELRRRSGNAPGPPSEQYRVISRIQRVNTTVDIQRLRIRFKDQLKVVNSEIKTIEQALRRQRERQRGYPAVAREPREGEADVPVAEVREHWKSIIGESQPFHPSDDLQAWSRSVQRGENRAAVDLSEETWAKIFAKIKPWKATGPRRHTGLQYMLQSPDLPWYCGRQNGKMVKSEPLGVRRGVMQGDTLSPLLCMAIAPISAWLRNNVSPCGTSTGALTLPEGPPEVNHLFFFTGELGLRMNPSKCAVNSLNHPPPPLVTTPGMDEIPVLGSSSLYKYLGAEQERSSVMAENRLEDEVTRIAQASIQVKDRTFAAATEAARAISTLVHERWARTRMHEWKQRVVASSNRRTETDEQPYVCHKDSFLWSQTGWVSSEVLRNVWAAQEASLPTRAIGTIVGE
ncbi:hypothetical protein COOONC_15230 [Cooperia oncophora]